MPFGTMNRVGPRYHVLDGDPILQGEEAIFGENVAAHFKVMEHSTVSCAKTTEPIDMPFWMKTWVGPGNHVLDGVQISQGEGPIFGGCPGHSKALAIFAAALLRGLLPMDHSIANNVMQQKGSFSITSANSILKISGHRPCGLSVLKGAVG